jgi:hypothetical protein
MILKNSLSAVNGSEFLDVFRKPLYGSYCFSGIPNSIAQNYGGDPLLSALPQDVFPGAAVGFEKIIFLLVDGLGWRFFDGGLWDHPFSRRFEFDGVISKMTSMFPSTTVVHVLNMAANLTPAETGVLEWFYYEPTFGDVICPLPYTFAGDKSHQKLTKWNSDAHAVYPKKSFSNELGSLGVRCFHYAHKAYTPSFLTQATAGCAEVVPFQDSHECMRFLRERLEIPGRAYHYVYLDAVDSVSHKSGPSSQRAINEARKMLDFLHAEFWGAGAAKWKNTLLLVTADHGQVDTDLQNAIYVNRLWPQIEEHLKRAPRTGKPIVPCGGMGRNLFLHVKPESVFEVRDRLSELLRGRAHVALVNELVEAQIFGTCKPSQAFYERAGDVVVLPLASESVWWFEQGKHIIETRGNHGGLSAQEMEIPFFAFAYEG